VHFDRVGSETSSSERGEFGPGLREKDELLGREDVGEREDLIGRDELADREDDREAGRDQRDARDEREERPSARSAREGLPSRFRMRHSRHYVDELLGDKPLRTVREIPLAEIEVPADDADEELEALEDFEASIRRLGVLEPLLVGKGGSQYRVIAGARRLRAARKVGLNTVPCLVHDVDEDKLKDMRGAAMQRLKPASPPPPVEPVQEVAPAAPEPVPAPIDATQGLEFISALLPAMNAAGSDRLRWAVLTDLAGVELARARIAGLARDYLQSAAPIDRAPADVSTLLSDVIASVSTEVRLRDVRLEVQARDVECAISLDAALCRNVLTGIVQCLLGFAGRAGTTLEVQAQLTVVRPALIVRFGISDADVELGREAIARFFEAEWREHPAGPAGAQIMAAASKAARAHGGRIEVFARQPRSCAITFIVPRPLSDF
jgi:hypothetical protein